MLYETLYQTKIFDSWTLYLNNVVDNKAFPPLYISGVLLYESWMTFGAPTLVESLIYFILQVLGSVIGIGSPSSVSPSESVDSNDSNFESTSRSTPSHDSPTPGGLNWTPWKTGMAFSYRGRTLMCMKQEVNEPCEGFLDEWQMKLYILQSKFRIEVHIYTNEWVSLTNELLELSSHSFSLESFECLPGLATKLLVMVTGHVKALATSWFPGMLVTPTPGGGGAGAGSQSFVTYMPCWKCYAEIGTPRPLTGGTNIAVRSCFMRASCICAVVCCVCVFGASKDIQITS